MGAQAHGACVGQADGYERHRPEQTVLYEVVQEHFETFRARADEHGGLPKFVVREFEEFLRCGVLSHGLVHVGCTVCGGQYVVGFSCKRRGVCPSCQGRRMADTAAHLVDRVLPEVPLRQWVLSPPWRLHYRLGYDRQLCTEVLTSFASALSTCLRRRAKTLLGLRSVDDAHTGAVTFVQRYDSALRLNVHAHTLALDGVYVRDGPGCSLRFHPLPEPTDEDIADVARLTFERVKRRFERLGKADLLDEHITAAEQDLDPLHDEQPMLAQCYAASVQGTRLTGQQTLRLLGEPSATRQPPTGVAEVHGFNIHAQRAVDGRDRKQVERLCRYMARPSISNDRLSRLPDGKLLYKMKRRWADGTHSIVFEPMDLLSRLCALIPPPRFHMIRFYGVLAPHGTLRKLVVPVPKKEPDPQLSLFKTADETDTTAGSKSPNDTPTRTPWAALLKRVFAVDVQNCRRCGGRLRILECATKPTDIARVLRQHGLESEAPPVAPARDPPQLKLPFTTCSN